MNVLEKAEKALEYLNANKGVVKDHELQTAAGTLGRCLGTLGNRPNCTRHYVNLLHSALPTLLYLASNDSAEVRLVGDEALNRAVVGGFAFHAHKTNTILQNLIDHTKNARWIRAVLSRICLGDCWLRPGIGKIRTQAQTLFPKLSHIVRQTDELQLIVEALENNLPRLLNVLAEYTTDEEISELSKALLGHIETTSEPAVRRGISTCIAHLCLHREPLLTNILNMVFEKLWPYTSENTVSMGWFSIIKAVFQINDVSKFSENDLFNEQDYLELYHLCIRYIEQTNDHNTQNCVLECLTVLLSQARGVYRNALLENHPKPVCLDQYRANKGHRRNISSSSVISSRFTANPSADQREGLELSFTGALHLGSLLHLDTPSLSVEDLTIQTPGSPSSETDQEIPNTEQLTKDLSEKLQEYEDIDSKDSELIDQPHKDIGFKVNIGSADDDDVRLKYCAKLIASTFLLTGNKGGYISDRTVRVSVKSSALNCLLEIVQIYPQAVTLYLDKDADMKNHNMSGSSEGIDHNHDNNEYILERNICYQDSFTESLTQDLGKSIDSQQTSLPTSKKERTSEIDEQKSSKDISSDSRLKTDLVGSGITDSTNPNMSISNFTTNSNMTGSNDPTSGYPMSTSADVLSSSIDLDMKFDHFGESTTNLDNLRDLGKGRGKRPLKRTDEARSDLEGRGLPEHEGHALPNDTQGQGLPNDPGGQVLERNNSKEKEFECQHMSELFTLLEGYGDPQIRGLVRVCIGNYLTSALSLCHGDYNRWRNLNGLPRDIRENLTVEGLVEIILQGVLEDARPTINHTLSALNNLSTALCKSAHWIYLIDILNALVSVETNNYWLCRVNLCKFYEKLPYEKLFMLYPGYQVKSKLIMDTLIRLLRDEYQKVRNAAAEAITKIIPRIYPSKRHTPTTMVLELSIKKTKEITFEQTGLALDLVRDIYFYHDLPRQLKNGDFISGDSLRIVVGDIFSRLMASDCKNYSQGLLEALQSICKKWSPYKNVQAYSDQGILGYCLDSLDYCNGTVATRTVLLDLCAMVYPVEIHNVMRHKTSNRDVFERDTTGCGEKWQHLQDDRVANLAEKFLQVTLKMLNVLVHLIEEVNPNVHLNKSGIALPGSPVRRKTQDSIPIRKSSIPTEALDEKGSLRKKPPTIANSLKANFTGHFYNEPSYMRFYENLRATYSNHKINLDLKGSIFYAFLSTTLDSLAIQLEFATEKELGNVTEEILYYLKGIMPLCAEPTVYCVTQLLKCLFGTNMVNQYTDYMSIADKIDGTKKTNFYEDVLLISPLETENISRRSSVCSNTSQFSLNSKNPRMADEKQFLITLENFAKNKCDRKWSTNKKELERYIRLFEPVVIQALKSYTMQNNIPLQCQVLNLLNQLLTLRVNYCMLDSDQIFIGFLLKQLDLVEQHEIPDCCELVNSILMFLEQLSSSKHHTKQIIEIPKLIQLCDGLMASGAHAECISGLEPVAVRVFSNMGGGNALGRAQQQEAQATREVLFYMLQKTMHQHRVMDLVSCVLSLSQEHPESYYRYSELASDTLLNLLTQRSVEIDSEEAVCSLEKLLDSVYKDVLLEQSRVEVLLKILFKSPPDQATTPPKLKLRYLSIIMVLLRKILIMIPESEILLSINYLKATCISPQSIFFNVKTDIDPLNVQNVNENCANLSPDVVLVRFLFKTLTYAILEIGSCTEINDTECGNNLLYAVCVNIIVQVKNMLHLTTGCLFPLTAKTAQTILHNEQSGLNTGLYSPEENIPLDALNLVCLKSAYRLPLLTVHWSHLLIRLNFLTHKYWQKLVGFARNLPLSGDNGDTTLLKVDSLQIACVMAYCEYFVENGLSEAVHLTWLLANRVHVLVSQYSQNIVQGLVSKVQMTGGASGLLLQAIAARCQGCLKDEFALNTYKILSLCHESQSGALVFLICRIIGKLEPAIAVRFSNLAVERCKLLKELPVERILKQLSKEDVQVALELLQRNKIHVRYSSLVMELNSLAATVFDLSPLDLSQDRVINPQYILTTNIDRQWLLSQVKSRCCQSDCTFPKITKQYELATLLSNLSHADITTAMSCQEFDKKILSCCFKVACDNYLREFSNNVFVYEMREHQKDLKKEQMEMKMQEEMTSSIDSNKLNVVNTLHVFKKSDSKESKSQFFIPINDNVELKDFGNLEITDEETELTLPEIPEIYSTALSRFDKSLIDVIRLFPKQNRPLSQSENFSLSIEQTIDRYTRRCHQVFQDKLFYQEFLTLQSIMTGFLNSLTRMTDFIDEANCELIDKIAVNLLPVSIAKNISIFSVISLQYLSFLIKNKKIVESPVHGDVSFRMPATSSDNVTVDNVIELTIDNVSKALAVKWIWVELNVESNSNRIQSAVSCLYAVVKYLVKDTRPLVLKHYMQTQDAGPRPDIMVTGDKLVTLIDYWEQNMYANGPTGVMGNCYKVPIESLLISLSRLDLVSNIALIPPIAWSSVDVVSKKDHLEKIDLSLQTLQDMDVLEAFLFRVNLIGWSSKKQFEEMWVGVLGALQGNGPHWAVMAATNLLLTTVPKRARRFLHIPRVHVPVGAGMQRLRNILIGTKAYSLFDDINLERVPLLDDGFDGYHYSQFSTEFLRLASDISDHAPFKVRKEVKRLNKYNEIDVNSCLQILMDVTTQMLDPKAPTGLCSRLALLQCLTHASCAFGSASQWWWAGSQLVALAGPAHAPLAHCAAPSRASLTALSNCLCVLDGFDGLQELSTVHTKLLKSLSSSYAPLRQAALHGCLLQLSGKAQRLSNQSTSNPYQELVTQLNIAVKNYLPINNKISLYEQCLYWTVLFRLIELGNTDLIHIAVDFLLAKPRHYCIDLVVKGIIMAIRQHVLPKELKNLVIEKLLDNMKIYSEHHAIQILMVHLFTANNKLLSPKLTTDVSNMDPDVLMSSMERITLLYKSLRQTRHKENRRIIVSALKYFLRETLPPAATLSRVVIEFLEFCKETERVSMDIISDRDMWIDISVMNAEIVFEVFETSVTQDQLPVLSGWIFEALCHLLSGKVSSRLMPYVVLPILVSASSKQSMREIVPLTYAILKAGFYNNVKFSDNWGIFKGFLRSSVSLSFSDRRLLCLVGMRSDFASSQLERLKELCIDYESLEDLLLCLSV